MPCCPCDLLANRSISSRSSTKPRPVSIQICRWRPLASDAEEIKDRRRASDRTAAPIMASSRRRAVDCRLKSVSDRPTYVASPRRSQFVLVADKSSNLSSRRGVDGALARTRQNIGGRRPLKGCPHNLVPVFDLRDRSFWLRRPVNGLLCYAMSRHKIIITTDCNQDS